MSLWVPRFPGSDLYWKGEKTAKVERAGGVSTCYCRGSGRGQGDGACSRRTHIFI